MTTINRKDILAEELIRDYVRGKIISKLKKNTIFENKLRKVIKIILEAETGTEEASTNTGINVLADLLEKIIPTIENDYKMLTSSSEQRESFRNHIVHAIQNTLRPIETATDAEQSEMAENILFSFNKNKLAEEIKIDLNPDDDESVSGEFIDIDKQKSLEKDDFVELEDQNETGRNFAAISFKKVEKQIVDSFDMLADEEDQNLFYDYLLTNILLYFDKFEDELQSSLPDVTTPEYEKEKEENKVTSKTSEDEEEDSEQELEDFIS
tara:strand:- start:483 stop:1283 length:801 start_codon:yes stop_codon:yes gene_type:complete